MVYRHCDCGAHDGVPMAVVSIITACTRPDFLPDLAVSVLAQTGDWEWLVQLDGSARTEPVERHSFSSDARIRMAANPRDAGSAVTRNLALLRASGDFVLCVDDDDLLLPGALGALLEALHAHPTCFAAWGGARTFDDDPAMSRDFKSWGSAGLVGPNEIGPIFEETGVLPVHVGACLWRRHHLEAVGGYAALLRSIDTNPFLACERLFPLIYVDRYVYLYRQHAKQMSNETAYEDTRVATHAFNFARTRAIAALWSHATSKGGALKAAEDGEPRT